MSNEKLIAALIALAKRLGFTLTETDHMVRLIAQADIDPLPATEWGEPFTFGPRVPVFDDDDFLCINGEVPKPDAQVDLLAAWKEYVSDVRTAALIFEIDRDLSITQLMQLTKNASDWFRFWSVRHPNAQSRAKYAEGDKASTESMSRNADKAIALLRERGIEVLNPRRLPNDET
jgi:hypothetical protein